MRDHMLQFTFPVAVHECVLRASALNTARGLTEALQCGQTITIPPMTRRCEASGAISTPVPATGGRYRPPVEGSPSDPQRPLE